MTLAPLAMATLLGSTASADELPDRNLMVAAQLAVTVEPEEVGGMTVGLNVAPLVVEWAFSPWVGLRANTLLNAQFGGPVTGLAHRGGGLSLPVYLPSRGDFGAMPGQGFYLGPFAGFSTNPLVDGTDLTLAAEAGVRFRLAERWSLSFALQGGGSRLERPTRTAWVNHLGLYPSIGVWL